MQCDHVNNKVINSSSDSLFQNVQWIILEECAVEKSFPNDYQCNPRLQSVVRVKLLGTGGSVSGDYSAVLGYLSQCTSVIDLEILDTSLRQIMRLESCAALQSLRLTNNLIAELQIEDFQALTKLRVLDLARNKLVRIPSRVFTNNRRLSRLCLARNIISFITRQSFLGKILFMS